MSAKKVLPISANLGVAWGIIGVAALLSMAILRLGARTLEAFDFDLHWPHWLVLIGCVGFMAYAEGYKGFQKAFAPRVAARLKYLRTEPRCLHVLLAPLFCMGYFHTTTRRLWGAYGLTAMIVAFLLLLQHVQQPWRGLLDAGVVVGLIWGLLALIWFTFKALTDADFAHSPELPSQS